MPKLTEQIVVFVPAMPTIAAQAQRIAGLETEVARLRDVLIEQGHGDGCDSNRPFCGICGKYLEWHNGTFCHSVFGLARFTSPGTRPCNCHLSTLPAPQSPKNSPHQFTSNPSDPFRRCRVCGNSGEHRCHYPEIKEQV
jgi:hypothetical protein